MMLNILDKHMMNMNNPSDKILTAKRLEVAKTEQSRCDKYKEHLLKIRKDKHDRRVSKTRFLRKLLKDPAS